MKLKRVMALFISVLFVLMPVIVEAKSIELYDNTLASYTIQLAEEEEHIGDNVCQEENVINALRVVGYFIFIGKIAIPFIIIGFGIFDLAKAVTGGDSDKVSKGVKTIGVRVLIGILVFALPSIINVVLDIGTNINDEETGYGMCQTCLLDPWACENGEPEEEYDPNQIFTDVTGGTTTAFVEQKTSSTHNAGANGTTTPRPTSNVEKQTSSTHNAGNNGTTTQHTSKVFIEVED